MPLSFCPSTFLSFSPSLCLFLCLLWQSGQASLKEIKIKIIKMHNVARLLSEREKAKCECKREKDRERVRETERNVALARQDEKLLLFMAEVDNAKDEQDAGDDDAAAAC